MPHTRLFVRKKKDETSRPPFSLLDDFQVHLGAYNENGHRMDVRYGKGKETLFSWFDHGDWTLEKLERKARNTYYSIKQKNELTTVE